MLEQVLDYIHNYFVKEAHQGTFTITGGNITGVDLLDGQYFKVVGSIFNDGVHQYPATDLNDEQFDGEVLAMAVPPAVIALNNDIDDWIAKYSDTMDSPYQSESFGGYSYTKKSGGGSNDGNDSSDWRSVFRSRLNHWRKIS